MEAAMEKTDVSGDQDVVQDRLTETLPILMIRETASKEHRVLGLRSTLSNWHWSTHWERR
jgi:hypothetical protein